jgi:hypothetical protein
LERGLVNIVSFSIARKGWTYWNGITSVNSATARRGKITFVGELSKTEKTHV